MQWRDGVEVVAVILEIGDLPVAVRRLLHGGLEREGCARPVVAHLDLSRCRRAVARDLADADKRGVAHLAAREEALVVDAELASLEDVRAFRQAPLARAHAPQDRVLRAARELRLDRDVELLVGGLVDSCQRRVVGEQVCRQVVVAARGHEVEVDVVPEAVGILLLDGDRRLLERVFRCALLGIRMPAEEGAEREDQQHEDQESLAAPPDPAPLYGLFPSIIIHLANSFLSV